MNNHYCGGSDQFDYEGNNKIEPILALQQKALSAAGLIKYVYKAMESRDCSDVVMTWFRIINESQSNLMFSRSFYIVPADHATKKSNEISKLYRVRGNKFLASSKHQAALVCYNRALLFATPNSRELVLAYSNRSALFYKFKLYSASLKDVETCFALGCPNDIREKLFKRKENCSNQTWQEKIGESMYRFQDDDTFLKINVKRNPQIPCASAAVGVVVKEGTPSVVAASDIEVGTVVAVENAFATQNSNDNLYYSCYYCNAIKPNLFPCDCCCYALFCSQACKEQCDKEYHTIETVLLNRLNTNLLTSLRAAIKIRQACESWEEFCAASENINSANIANHTVKEMFDSNEKFSLLRMDTDKKYFNYGTLYSSGRVIASLMAAIDGRTSFFPGETEKKKMAIKAFARVMMKLFLFVPNLLISDCLHNGAKSTISMLRRPNRGMFSFASKLKHECNPNLVCLGLQNKMALVAVRPVRRGEPLTISYVLHWMQTSSINRPKELYFFNKLCDCTVCTECWSIDNNQQPISDANINIWMHLNYSTIAESLSLPVKAQKYRTPVFEALGKLSSEPRTKEYCQVFCLFLRYMLNFQHAVTKNKILNELTEDCMKDLSSFCVNCSH